MFGPLHSKLRGLRHIYVQYFGKTPAPTAIKLYSPLNNRECLHCHAGMRAYEEEPKHNKTPDMMSRLNSNPVSCLTGKCHDTHDVGTLDSVTSWKGGN